MMCRLLILLQLLLLCAAPSYAAPEIPPGRNAALTLYADRTAVVPGQPLKLAVDVRLRDGWHSYWINPGDSGDVMRLAWTVPDQVKPGDIQWPVPHRLPFGPLLNFGYEKQVAMIVPAAVDSGLAAQNVAFKAKAEILVCEDICIPETHDLSLTLPVSDASEAANADLFKVAEGTLPVKETAALTYAEKDGNLVVTIDKELPKDSALYPLEWGLIENTAEQKVDVSGNRTVFTVQRGTRALDGVPASAFVVAKDHAGWQFDGKLGAVSDVTGKTADTGILQALLFALLGGIILNLMPCVFPILSMKALSLVKLSTAERTHARAEALAYTAGILLSFGALAGVMIALKAGGAAIGWGFQLQSPVLVTVLCWVMVLVGLNLLGVFTVNRFIRWGDHLLHHRGWGGAFFTGVLATVVATPCSAPFMATALGAALVQPAPIAILIFLCLGLGLALPFLLVSFIPAISRALPRPGAWMETFKQVLAFPMFATAVWLAWVVAGQAGVDSVPYVAGGAVLIAFLVWLSHHKTILANIVHWLGIVALVWMALAMPVMPAPGKSDIHVFSPEKLEQALAEKRPVFVNMTAKWCVTCLVNERTTLSSGAVMQAFAAANVLYLKGDWTSKDPVITKYLEDHGRDGVPLYVLYQDGKETVLPQILTPTIVTNALTKE